MQAGHGVSLNIILGYGGVEVVKEGSMVGHRFLVQPLLLMAALAGIIYGGWFMWTGGLLVSIAIPILDQLIGTASCGKTSRNQNLRHISGSGDIVLYLSVGLTFVLVATFLWKVSASAGMSEAAGGSGWPVLLPDNWLALLGGAYSIAMLLPIVGTTGHELAHRTRKPDAFLVSQALFALMLNPSFPIAHVFSHHRLVAAPGDCETAYRGESYWKFFFRSTWLMNKEAFVFEARRSGRRGARPINRVAIGALLVLTIWLATLAMTGFVGLFWLMGTGLAALVTVQIFAYVGHFGLIRVPGQSVKAHHSWQWPHVLSSGMLVNITRHPDHHLHAQKKYNDLSIVAAAPTYPYGPVIMVMLALVPPLFFSVVRQELSRWDRELASRGELLLVYGERGNRQNKIEDNATASSHT